MSDADVLDLYELLARDVCAENMQVRVLLDGLISNAKPKHDTHVHMSKAVSRKRVYHCTVEPSYVNCNFVSWV